MKQTKWKQRYGIKKSSALKSFIMWPEKDNTMKIKNTMKVLGNTLVINLGLNSSSPILIQDPFKYFLGLLESFNNLALFKKKAKAGAIIYAYKRVYPAIEAINELSSKGLKNLKIRAEKIINNLCLVRKCLNNVISDFLGSCVYLLFCITLLQFNFSTIIDCINKNTRSQ